MQQRVFFDFGGSIGAAIAAHVRSDRVEAGFGQGPELMAPGIPGLREAVTEHDQRAFALLRHVHSNSVGLDRAVPHLAHGSLHSERAHGAIADWRGWPWGVEKRGRSARLNRNYRRATRISAMRAAI